MNAQGHVPSVPPRLAQWIDVLPVPVMLLDHRGRTLSINQAWEESATAGGLISPTDHRGIDHLHDLETGKGFAYASARDLAAGLRSVLEGKQEHCTVLYDLDDGAAWEAVVHRIPDFSVVAELEHVTGLWAACFTPDGTRLATGGDDGVIRVFDTVTWDLVFELRGHETYVHALKFSPDGTQLASGSGDGTIRLWRSSTGDLRRGGVRKGDTE